MVFMILAIFFILFGVLILVKYVVLIHKTNNKVISLFGMIKAIDIKTLTAKCEEFSEKFLENSLKQKDKEKFNTSYGGLTLIAQPDKVKPTEEDQSYIQVNPLNQTDLNINGENKIEISTIVIDENKNNKSVSSITKDSINNTTIINNLKETQNKNKNIQSFLTPPIKTNLGSTQVKKKNEEVSENLDKKKNPAKVSEVIKNTKKEEEEENLKNKTDEKENISQINRDEVRQRRLMNSVDNNTRVILLQYSIFVFMFWAYFIADYVFITLFLTQVRTCYSHLELIAERPSIVKYRIVFTYEEIANSAIQIQRKDIFDLSSPLIDVNEDYRSQMYANENNIFNSLKESYPSQFNEYENYFQILNYGNLCLNYIKSSDPKRFLGIFLIIILQYSYYS